MDVNLPWLRHYLYPIDRLNVIAHQHLLDLQGKGILLHHWFFPEICHMVWFLRDLCNLYHQWSHYATMVGKSSIGWAYKHLPENRIPPPILLYRQWLHMIAGSWCVDMYSDGTPIALFDSRKCNNGSSAIGEASDVTHWKATCYCVMICSLQWTIIKHAYRYGI